MITVKSCIPTFICLLMERGVRLTFGKDSDKKLFLKCEGSNGEATSYFYPAEHDDHVKLMEEIERALFMAFADLKGK